nr:HAD family phosphatase [Pseudoalteromonas sp. MMG010]
MIKAVLFDMDGTLVDSESMHFQCWSQILAPLNVFYQEDDFCQRFSGRPTVEAAKEIITQYNLPETPEQLAQRKHSLFSDYVQSHLPVLMPYAKQTLLAVKNMGLKMALVTGSARCEAEPILTGLGFYDLFDTLVTKDDVNAPKPAGDPYILALKQLNIPPHDGIAIEDTCTGVTAAHNANLAVVAIANSHTYTHDFTNATYQMKDLNAFLLWLESQL